MLFDAIQYLGRIDPSQTYKVDTLTGGSINVTLRATKIGDNTSTGRFPNHTSLVLKYAPPFVASIGKSLPVSTFRQVIEARALSLFSSVDEDTFSQLYAQCAVTVPKLLLHDLEDNVLIMSDMGMLPSLSEIFTDLCSNNPRAYSFIKLDELPEIKPARRIFYYSVIGSRVGSFLAKLHSRSTLMSLLHNPQQGPDFFENNPLANHAFNNFVKPIKNILGLFPQLLSSDEANLLYERLAKDMSRPVLTDEASFVFGDCWPGALLVSPFTQSTSADGAPKIAIVDWEFAGIGRGIHGDMAKLVGRFAGFRYAAYCTQDVNRQLEIDALISNLIACYRITSVRAGAPWTGGDRDIAATPFAGLEDGTLRARMVRSTFIAYAVEILICSYSKTWNCQDDRCMKEEKHTDQKHSCVLIQGMVEHALWFLRHAGHDEQEFCTAANILSLQLPARNGTSLLDLF